MGSNDPPPPWLTLLSKFSALPSSESLRVGHLLYLSSQFKSNDDARAQLTSELGIIDSRAFTNWFSGKLCDLRAKERKVKGERSNEKVLHFLSTTVKLPEYVLPSSQLVLPPLSFVASSSSVSNPLFSPPSPSTVVSYPSSFVSPSSSTIGHSSSTLSPLSFIPPPSPSPGAVAPLPAYSHSAVVSHSSSSTSPVSLIHPSSFSPGAFAPLSVASPSVASSQPSLTPSSSRIVRSSVLSPSSPSSSHMHSSLTPSMQSLRLPPSILSTFDDDCLPSTTSYDPSSPPNSPPSKAARRSIPASTPLGRHGGSRAGIRPPAPPASSSSGPTAFPDVSGYWEKEIAELRKVIAGEKKKKNRNLEFQLKRARNARLVASENVVPSSSGKETLRELELMKKIASLQRQLRDARNRKSSVPLSDEVFLTKTEEGFILPVKYAALLLSTLNVSDEKSGKVMEVMANMLGIRLSHIPSASTIRGWMPALNNLILMHAAEMLDKSEGGWTLLRDETTKRADKMQQHAVVLDKDNVLFLGYTCVPDKSALTSFASLRSKVESISRFSSDSHLFHSFVLKIRNLMSDRAATETLFNKIFKSVRDAYLELTEDWESLTPEEREKARLICVHYCHLHAIANLFGVVSRELIEQDSEDLEQQVDASTARFAVVIKEVPRFLGSRSAGGHREHAEWMEWSRKEGLEGGVIPNLLGHRFNIQFVIAARVFSLRTSIMEFIELAPKMAFLNEFLTSDLVLIHLQILGLLDQKVTGPLWRIAEHSSVADCSAYHQSILSYVDECIDDPARFFSEEVPTVSPPPPFVIFKVEDGDLLKTLVTAHPSPQACSAAQRVLTACSAYLKIVFSQSLNGGEYSNPTSDIDQCIRSAPTTNRAVESGFAFMDNLYRRAPHMTFYRREAITNFRLNHVDAWLDRKSVGERTKLLERAIEGRKEIVHEEREKKAQLGKVMVERLEQRAIDEREATRKADARKAKITKELGVTGLLANSLDIDHAIKGLADARALKLIKAQLRFRKNFLSHSAPHPSLFRFSEGGVVYKLPKIIENLKKLCAAEVIAGASEEDDFHSSLLSRTCQLTSDLFLPDGTLLSGDHKITALYHDEDGDLCITLAGSKGVFSFDRGTFEDLLQDGVFLLSPP